MWPFILAYGGWSSENLHQLIGGKHPIIYIGFQHVSTILLVMQNFATTIDLTKVWTVKALGFFDGFQLCI